MELTKGNFPLISPPQNVPEGTDAHTDLQWAKVAVGRSEYTDKPWEYSQDVVNAYLSLRISKRPKFLNSVSKFDQDKINQELQHIQVAREKFLKDDLKKELMRELKQSRQQWKERVEEALTEQNVNGITPRRETEAARTMRAQASKYPPNSPQFNELQRQAIAVNSRDQEIRKRVHEAIRNNRWNIVDGASDPTPEETVRHGSGSTAERDHVYEATARFKSHHSDFRAGVIYFKHNGTDWMGDTVKNDFVTDNDFPHQKMAVDDILSEEESNPLRSACNKDTIRWFHFPANNMGWVEKAMENYARGYMSTDDSDVSRAANLLSREHWRGQMHGTWPRVRSEHDARERPREHDACIHGPVHARHMRSRCSLIPRGSTDIRKADPEMLVAQEGSDIRSVSNLVSKDVCLFLPYLHWETSSRQSKMIDIVNHSEGFRAKSKPVMLKSNSKSEEKKNHLYDVVNKAMGKKKASNPAPGAVTSARQGKVPERFLLGRYLLKAAQVADQMDYAADERLLRSDINQEPPLHMRRTLDQYHFLTLDTSERDKDQVVYRETKTKRGYHEKPRVVMVDQLWMWILDDNTIITCFPKRWGRNKPDSSGVHKSLRDRLKYMNDREEGIQSIHHLAVIIIDQCSRVFFDRTRALDERPEVMDLFNSAIGHTTQYASTAYGNFWHYSRLHSAGDLPEHCSRYLDINPEGVILRESQDIIEELKIMLRIFAEQATVVREYRRYLGQLNGELKDGRKFDAPLMQRLIESLENRSREAAKANEEGGTTGKSSGKYKNTRVQRGQSWLNETIDHMDFLLEAIENRKRELLDLQESAFRTQLQLESLLQLKQQQASIIEAKASLRGQEESIRQGRAIMAFTIVTICFLPLGFFAAFFGMNNNDINDAKWMSLYQQIGYMFGLSAIVIALSVGLAFSDSGRATAMSVARMPFTFALWLAGFVRNGQPATMALQKVKKHGRLTRISRQKRVWEEGEEMGAKGVASRGKFNLRWRQDTPRISYSLDPGLKFREEI